MDSPLFRPGYRMSPLGIARLIPQLEAHQHVLLRVYRGANRASTAAAKINARWADGQLGIPVHVYTRKLADQDYGVYACHMEDKDHGKSE